MADIISSILRAQINLDCKMSRLAFATTVYIIISEFRHHKQEKELKALREELKELKHVEGE